jgi:predicted unusual protein kinase regulating ubiquinone biosynthesis (AarF/ABC1/UbiB family)
VGFLYVSNSYFEKVHADPHPGNFLVNDNNELVALDFGCMKQIPTDFTRPILN